MYREKTPTEDLNKFCWYLILFLTAIFFICVYFQDGDGRWNCYGERPLNRENFVEQVLMEQAAYGKKLMATDGRHLR
jgi:hypothetical protein